MSIESLIKTSGVLHVGSKGEAVYALQAALRRAGHEVLLDSDFGDITKLAVRRFQLANGLSPDGVVGKVTAIALDAGPSVNVVIDPVLPSSLAIAPWLSIQRAITGTKEIPGAADSPTILSWTGAILERYPELAPGVRGYTHDSIPWCGLDQAYCLAKSGYRPPLFPLYATNWFEQWKDGVRLVGPALGAIVVMKRTGGGHVTMYEGEDGDYWFGRGGNQSDMVNVARFPKSRPILGHMWPNGHPLPVIGPVHRSFANAAAASES